jgi:hypothetical protein
MGRAGVVPAPVIGLALGDNSSDGEAAPKGIGRGLRLSQTLIENSVFSIRNQKTQEEEESVLLTAAPRGGVFYCTTRRSTANVQAFAR